jgi:hypothetical protein
MVSIKVLEDAILVLQSSVHSLGCGILHSSEVSPLGSSRGSGGRKTRGCWESSVGDGAQRRGSGDMPYEHFVVM